MSVKILNLCWVRVLLYGVLLLAVAWTTYHVAYRNSCGVRCGDSDADLAFFEGGLWAAGMSATALLVCAAVEVVSLWRRASK